MATSMKLIGKITLGSDAADVTFSDIPGTYTDLLIVASARSSRASHSDSIHVQFNGSTSNLSSRWLWGSGGGTGSSSSSTKAFAGEFAADSATASTFGNGEIYLPNYAGSTNKSFSATGVSETNATVVGMSATAGLWSSTSAITSIKLLPDVGPNFKSGSSFFLYGITKA